MNRIENISYKLFTRWFSAFASFAMLFSFLVFALQYDATATHYFILIIYYVKCGVVRSILCDACTILHLTRTVSAHTFSPLNAFVNILWPKIAIVFRSISFRFQSITFAYAAFPLQTNTNRFGAGDTGLCWFVMINVHWLHFWKPIDWLTSVFYIVVLSIVARILEFVWFSPLTKFDFTCQRSHLTTNILL